MRMPAFYDGAQTSFGEETQHKHGRAHQSEFPFGKTIFFLCHSNFFGQIISSPHLCEGNSEALQVYLIGVFGRKARMEESGPSSGVCGIWGMGASEYSR